MTNRSTGWIQDPGELENLIKVVELFKLENRYTSRFIIKLNP